MSFNEILWHNFDYLPNFIRYRYQQTLTIAICVARESNRFSIRDLYHILSPLIRMYFKTYN